MKNIVKSVIETGRFDLSDILRKIDVLWVQGSISDVERADLIAHAQNGAKPENSVDIIAKITELEMRVKALEEGKTASGDTEGEDTNEATYPEYTVGKWYYSGDCINFEGKAYKCIAPEGQVCTWNPTEYPPYWAEISK